MCRKRLTLALTAAMAVICVAAIVAIWFIVEQGRSATLDLIATVAELERSRTRKTGGAPDLTGKTCSAPAFDGRLEAPLKVRVVFAREAGHPRRDSLSRFSSRSFSVTRVERSRRTKDWT